MSFPHPEVRSPCAALHPNPPAGNPPVPTVLSPLWQLHLEGALLTTEHTVTLALTLVCAQLKAYTQHVIRQGKERAEVNILSACFLLEVIKLGEKVYYFLFILPVPPEGLRGYFGRKQQQHQS